MHPRPTADRSTHLNRGTPMLLLLIRHAHAGDRDPEQWPDDRDRPLTDKGRKTQREVSRAPRQARPRAHQVLASPWARAAADRGDPGRRELGARAARRSRAPRSPTEPDLGAAGRRHRRARPGRHRRAGGPFALDGGAGGAAAHRIGGRDCGSTIPKSGVMGIDLERAAAGSGRAAVLPAAEDGVDASDDDRLSARPLRRSSQSSFCPKIARFDECPGFTFALGLM